MVSGARRATALAALWRALSTGRRGGPGLGARLVALPRLAVAAATGRYPGLSRGRLALMLAAVLYIVCPVDVVPELLLGVFGLADDAVVAAWVAGAVLVETDAFLSWEAGGGSRRTRTVPGELIDPPRRR